MPWPSFKRKLTMTATSAAVTVPMIVTPKMIRTQNTAQPIGVATKPEGGRPSVVNSDQLRDAPSESRVRGFSAKVTTIAAITSMERTNGITANRIRRSIDETICRAYQNHLPTDDVEESLRRERTRTGRLSHPRLAFQVNAPAWRRAPHGGSPGGLQRYGAGVSSRPVAAA